MLTSLKRTLPIPASLLVTASAARREPLRIVVMLILCKRMPHPFQLVTL